MSSGINRLSNLVNSLPGARQRQAEADYTVRLQETIRQQQAEIDRLTEQVATQQVFCARYESRQYELIALTKEVLRISDRDHNAWNNLKALIAEIEAGK